MSETHRFNHRHWNSPDGLRLHAREYGLPGDRLPVVCIPGLTRNARDFEEVAPWIAARGRRVFAVDLRGRGESERDPRKRYNPRVYADDMAALLAAIDAPRALFVGTSLGGLVAMTLAARHPALVGGAVLNDVGPKVAKAGLLRIRGYVGKVAQVDTWEDAAAYARRINGIAFPDQDDLDWMTLARRMFREQGGRPVLDYDPSIFSPPSRFLVWVTQPLVWAAFRKLAAAGPLALIHGGISDVIGADTIARMKAIAPHLQVTAIPGVGHAPMLTEPAALEAMAAFLDHAP